MARATHSAVLPRVMKVRTEDKREPGQRLGRGWKSGFWSYRWGSARIEPCLGGVGREGALPIGRHGLTRKRGKLKKGDTGASFLPSVRERIGPSIELNEKELHAIIQEQPC